MYKKISKYLKDNYNLLKYSSSAKEDARIEKAKILINDESLEVKQVAKKILEGSLPPPKKGRKFEIVSIKFLINEDYMTIYNEYKSKLVKKLSSSYSFKLDFKRNKQNFVLEDRNFPIIDDSIGELYLFHAPDYQYLQNILTLGFRPDLSRNYKEAEDKYYFGALGAGTYFTESLSKAMTYVSCSKCKFYSCGKAFCKEGEFFILLSRVALGRPLFVDDRRSRRSEIEIPAEFDSVIGKSWEIVTSHHNASVFR